MPAKSKAQQQLFGIAHAVQTGKLSPSEVSDDAKKIAKNVSPSDVEKFAKTKHKGLPKHVEEKLREYIRHTIKEILTELNESDKWIQNAINPSHKGYCTPMTKKTCTPRRKALAKRFKKGIENESSINEAIFSRKNYIEIANIIKNSLDKDDIAMSMADMFEKDNPLFDRSKFLAACGV